MGNEHFGTPADGKTQSAVAIIAAEMRRIVEAEPDAPHASTERKMGDLEITLSRSGNRWALTLVGAQPLDQATADLWAQAVGVPQTQPPALAKIINLAERGQSIHINTGAQQHVYPVAYFKDLAAGKPVEALPPAVLAVIVAEWLASLGIEL